MDIILLKNYINNLTFGVTLANCTCASYNFKCDISFDMDPTFGILDQFTSFSPDFMIQYLSVINDNTNKNNPETPNIVQVLSSPYHEEFLEATNNELEELNLTLEEKVEQRTEELKMTNKKLEQTNAKLHKTTQQLVQSEKLSAIGELTAGITHELNNPLNGIKIINQSLIKKIEKNEIDIVDAKKDFHDVIDQIDKMAKIIDHMMKFSHVSSHQHHEKINIGETITNALMFIEQQLENNNIILDLEIDESLPETKGYGIQIEQVIINLVNNAKKSLEKTDRENKFIKIIAKKIENNIEIEVSDNGVGIPKDIKDDIFEPFFTTNERGEGFGLGMGIIKRIVSEHEGEIKLASTPGEGTSFIIKLPVKN